MKYQELKTQVNEIQGSLISDDLITNLAADEIYKYCSSCIKELEEIANTSQTLNEKTERKKAFIESFLGMQNTDFIIVESEMNKY